MKAKLEVTKVQLLTIEKIYTEEEVEYYEMTVDEMVELD